eukprot:gene5065-5564_t
MGGRQAKVADYEIIIESSEENNDNAFSLPISQGSERMKPSTKMGTLNSSLSSKSSDRTQRYTSYSSSTSNMVPSQPKPRSSSSRRRASELPDFLERATTNQMDLQPLERRIAEFERRHGIRYSQSCSWLLKRARLSNLVLSTKAMEFGPTLFRSSRGCVKLCFLAAAREAPRKYFVMKCIPKEISNKRNRYEKYLENEKLVLSSLNSPFCMQYFGCLDDKENFYLALEYAPGGDLHRYLYHQKLHRLSNEAARFYAAELFVALEHVHKSGFVYRDCKPENVGIDELGHVKLLDMGLATKYRDPHKLHTFCGTPAYLSPEQLDSNLTNGYTEVVDWWAFGVVIFELLTGRTPFVRSMTDSPYEIFLRIMNRKISFPRNVVPTSRRFIASLCLARVDERLTDMENIKKHEFFSLPWDAVYERRIVPPFIPRLERAGDHSNFEGF